MMQVLYDKQNVAFENAMWLRTVMQSKLMKHDGKIYLLNPYTNIDILVNKITIL
jgi:hypothetical protein